MIKYDYKIIRDEGNEEITYVPKMNTMLSALTNIEGPNSSGKSTLLNLMGVAFIGNKRKDINETLRARMDSIINSEHQKVEFDIKIDEHGEIITIKKDLESKIISFRVDGKILSPEKVEEKYNLIYDIPEDPINRIVQLVTSIKTNQEQMSSKLSALRIYMQAQLNDVKNSKNQDKILGISRKIDDCDRDIQNLNEEIENQEVSKKIFKSYFNMYWYRDSLVRLSSVEKKIKDIKNISKDINRKVDNKNLKLQIKVDDYILDCERISAKVHSNLRNFLKDSKQLLEAWYEVDYQDIKKAETVPNRYFKTIAAIIEKLEIVNKSVDNKKRKNYEMWQKIINILENASDSHMKIPGSDKKLNEFLMLLKKETSGLKKEIDNITMAEDLLEEIILLEENLVCLQNEILPEFIKAKREIPESININTPYDSNSLNKEKILYSDKVEKYRKGCIANGIDIDNEEVVSQIKANFITHDHNGRYRKYSEVESEALISELENSELKRINQLDKVLKMKDFLSNELNAMINSPEHKYSNRSIDIEKLINLSMNLKQKMDSYSRQLDELSRGNYLAKPENEMYYPFVYKYLGHKIGFVRHIEGLYEVEYVDLSKKEMLTISGKRIRFTDMGTGQSQSAYLVGKLNTLDHRKIIALIDEVAMMDEKSLAPVYAKLKDLHDKKKLLAAIVVQKSDILKVREF